jgi:cytochrome c553
VPSHHRLVALPTDDAPRLGQPHYVYNGAVTDALPAHGLPRPSWETVSRLPSQTYDEVWVEAGTVTARSQFVTSSQCIGCHDAGGTGLQFDMTAPNPHGSNLLNLSPYATWRTSPMGLGGRDPIFYAQLQSEIGFHPEAATTLQGVCMGCHGVAGPAAVRDRPRRTRRERASASPSCASTRAPVPWPADNPERQARALRRAGARRHQLPRLPPHARRRGPENPAIDRPENRCVKERQDFLNPHNTRFREDLHRQLPARSARASSSGPSPIRRPSRWRARSASSRCTRRRSRAPSCAAAATPCTCR